MNAPLELHLKLDGSKVENRWHDGHGVATASRNTLEDSSGNGLTCAFFGNADIVADDAFGACANFDGDTGSYIKAPAVQALKITGDVTIEAWVYITKAVKDWVRVIGKGTVDSRSYGLWYIMTDTETKWLFQRGPKKPFHDCEAKSPTTLNTWYHLAGVVEGKKSILYVHDLKGKLIARKELDQTPSGAAIDNDSPLTIGYGMMNAAHSGKIAHARIYKGARSQVEIEHDISSDRLALVPFRKSHPIDFRLYDENGQPALYIVDDSADAKITTVKLELTNSSTQSIQIPPAPPATGADDHHFALCFRPGTLSDSTKKKLKELTRANQATMLTETDEWELAHAGKDPGPVNLFLSYKGPKKSFDPQEKLTLTLHGISADAGSGSRGTQVELIPRHLTYVNDDTPITGSRMRYLHITNHRGQKNIPLHVWFVDRNTVLNDGKSPTDLTLHISNGSGDRDILLNEASRFVISFDVGDPGNADWALTDKKSADKVMVKHGKDDLTKPGGGQDTNDTFREWELKFPSQQVLAKRGSKNSKPIEITLKEITTSLSTGHANLYVRYENIPGYQDGQFILTVEKTPLVYDAKGNIAIGKSIREKDPPKVDVNGTIDVNGTVIAERLSVSRETKKRGGLFFAVAGDFNHAVYNNLSNLDGEGAWDGAKWNTHEGLNVRVGSQNPKPSTLRSALLINATGNVGIGADLDIKKDVVSSLTINKKIANGAHYDYSAAPLSIFLPLGKHNGGSKPVGTEDILHLVREGVADQAFGNKVSLAIGRYENDGLNSRTQFDIKLTDGLFTDHKAVLSLRSNGFIEMSKPVANSHISIGRRAAKHHDEGNVPSSLQFMIYDGWQAGMRIESERITAPNGSEGNSQYIAFDTHNAWQESGERMRIAMDGNVGIGTKAPKAKLDIHGEQGPGGNPALMVHGSLIIHTEGITNKEQAKEALNGVKHSIVFFVNGPNLNWGLVDGNGNFHNSWVSND